MSKQQLRTRVKICGMTDAGQVDQAVSLGVDAIGVILHADSPRRISVDQARLIRNAVPAFVTLVGVFVDAKRETIEHCINVAGIDLVQLHGGETEGFSQTLSRPYIKAVRAKSTQQVNRDCEEYSSARAILLDPYKVGQHGGTGELLDQTLWPKKSAQPLILAGGLSADNVANRISKFSPFAVDLNSGLELEPGVKDLDLLAKAVRQVRLADLNRNEN